MAPVFQEAACRVGEVASDLRHPCPVGTVGDAGDVNATSFQIDDEKHEVADKPADRQHLNAEEVSRCDRAPMSPQERAPRKRLAPARGRLDSVLSQDALDRGASHVETEVVQRSAQACVAPRGALPGHRQQLLRYVARRRWSPRRGPRLRAIVLRRDHPTVPTQNRLGRCERRQLGQHGPAEPVTLLGHQPAFGVREPQAPRAEAFAEHPVLGLQVRDGQLLPPMDPTGHQKDQKLEWGGRLRRSHGRARQSPVATAPEGAAIAKAPRFMPGPVSGQDGVQPPDRVSSLRRLPSPAPRANSPAERCRRASCRWLRLDSATRCSMCG